MDIYINGYRRVGFGQISSVVKSAAGTEEMREIEKYAMLLKGIVGDTVLGKWTEYYFPKVYISGMQEKYAVLIGCFEGFWEAGFKVEHYFEHEPTDNDISNMVEECIFLMMMYPDLLKWKKLQLEIYHEADEGGVGGIGIQHNGEVQFELSAFITFSIFYPYSLHKYGRITVGFLSKKGRG